MYDLKYDIGELKNDILLLNKTNVFEFYTKKSVSPKKTKFYIHYAINNGKVELSINGQPFNIDKLFKKSSLEEWHVVIKDSSDLKIDCWMLNTFLSLGAQLTLKNYKKTNVVKNERFYDLSFQHGVRIFESAK